MKHTSLALFRVQREVSDESHCREAYPGDGVRKKSRINKQGAGPTASPKAKGVLGVGGKDAKTIFGSTYFEAEVAAVQEGRGGNSEIEVQDRGTNGGEEGVGSKREVRGRATSGGQEGIGG